MQAKPQKQPVDLQLPLMYAAPHQLLSSMDVRTDTLGRYHEIETVVNAAGISVRLLYTYWDPHEQRFVGAAVLDFTHSSTSTDQVARTLSQLPGVDVRQIGEPNCGLAALEKDRLQAVGTPVVVMARQIISDTYKLLVEGRGAPVEALLFQAGEKAGRQAAAGVPALVASLGTQLNPQLLRNRFFDLQVFGWATVVALRVDEHFIGEALLADDFEAVAWQGQASSSQCHWIRGFLTGALSSLTGTSLSVTEPDCQAKGDQYCRMIFRHQ